MLPNDRSRGFTLIELLVSISIIGILIALLLPGVQSVRESSRKVVCGNHLRQLVLGMHLFHNSHRQLPSNGWGFRWLGEPGRGVGQEQPGGWAFQILPFVEQGHLVTSLVGLTGAERANRLARLASAPLDLFRCPSRPGDLQMPNASNIVYFNASQVLLSNRTDYAINEGDWVSDSRMGPPSDSISDIRAYQWIDPRK